MPPSALFCTVSRQRTNTPLQALVLLNDPQFVEAARVLAERMIVEAAVPLGDRIAFAFRAAHGPRPDADGDATVLDRLYRRPAGAVHARQDARRSQLLSRRRVPRDRTLDARR